MNVPDNNALTALADQCDAVAERIERQIAESRELLAQVDDIRHTLRTILENSHDAPAPTIEIMPPAPEAAGLPFIQPAGAALFTDEIGQAIDNVSIDEDVAEFEVEFTDEQPLDSEIAAAPVVPQAEPPTKLPLSNEGTLFSDDPYLETMMISRDDLPFIGQPPSDKTKLPKEEPPAPDAPSSHDIFMFEQAVSSGAIADTAEPPSPQNGPSSHETQQFPAMESQDGLQLPPWQLAAADEVPTLDAASPFGVETVFHPPELPPADRTARPETAAMELSPAESVVEAEPPVFESGDETVEFFPREAKSEPKKEAKHGLITGDDLASSLDQFFGIG